MEALQTYRGSDDEGEEQEQEEEQRVAAPFSISAKVVSSAPDVDANTHLLIADAAKSGAILPGW